MKLLAHALQDAKKRTKTTSDYYRYLLLKSKGVEVQYTGEEQ